MCLLGARAVAREIRTDGYSATPLFQRFEGCFKGPLPRHLPEVASRIPTQGSKGNGDSGRLVPRTRAGEQALQRDTPLKRQTFARKGRRERSERPMSRPLTGRTRRHWQRSAAPLGGSRETPPPRACPHDGEGRCQAKPRYATLRSCDAAWSPRLVKAGNLHRR